MGVSIKDVRQDGVMLGLLGLLVLLSADNVFRGQQDSSLQKPATPLK